MKEQKIPLSEEIVKYIFPGTSPVVVQAEDGYIVHDFKKLYPIGLGIFVPNEVDRSNYNAIFPKPFESYFLDMHEEVAHLSRLLEIPITSNLSTTEIVCMPGVILRNSEANEVVFRFDKLLEARKKTELLCRANLDRLTIGDKVRILNVHPLYRAEASDWDGGQYLYWIMPIEMLFSDPGEILAATFEYSLLLHH